MADDDDDGDLLGFLLSYSCPYSGAKRMAGLGLIEPTPEKSYGCNCFEHLDGT